MRNGRRYNKLLPLIATVLMILAIPISLVGLQTVNDIRNRAGVETQLDFATDFSSPGITQVLRNIPYQQTLELTGDLAPIATISLGCDPSACGTSCPETTQNPPAGFTLAADGKTLFWEDPISDAITNSWPITVTATSPSPDNPDVFICAVHTFTLEYSSAHNNVSPSCTLLPSPSSGTLPTGIETPLRLEASDPDGGIMEVTATLSNNSGIVESKEWTPDNSPKQVFLDTHSTPSLSFIAQTTGTHTFSAEVTDTEGATSQCEVQGDQQINVVIPGENGSPVFTSDPYTQSTPGTALNIGQSYSYTLEANDPDSDTIDYFVINNTGWLTFTVNSTDSGSFRGTFSGTPTAAGSYTAGIALNDGTHNHYSTQLWVINVNYPENDVPVVSITLPPSGTSINNDETMRIEWQATDRNLIERFDVFLTTDPQNASAMIPLVTGLGYNYNSYLWDVGSTPPGYYYVVVHATDNQSPPATGIGISPSFGISVSAQNIPPVQPVVTGHPTITHLTPSDKGEIEKTDPLISADLTAADNATIASDTITIKLDDTDISDLITLQGKDADSGSFMYQPASPLGMGAHRVSVLFEDSSGQTASKTWTFTIVEQQESEDDQEQDTGDSETISLLGFEIPKRIAIIVGVGVVLLIIALAIPWLFYAAWKGAREEEALGYREDNGLPISRWEKTNSDELVINPEAVDELPYTLPEKVYPANKSPDTLPTPKPPEPLEIRETPPSHDLQGTTPKHEAEAQVPPQNTQVESIPNPTAPPKTEEEEHTLNELQEALNQISNESGYNPIQPPEPSKPKPPSQEPEEPVLIKPAKPPLSPSDL
jgi:hypothetical protein